MLLPTSSARRGAALALIGTVLILWAVLATFLPNVSSSLSENISSLLSNPGQVSTVLVILFLLGINGWALLKRLPTWLVVSRLVILVCGLLVFLVNFILVLDWRCAEGCQTYLTPGDFFRSPFGSNLVNLFILLVGLSLNFLGVFLSRRHSRSNEPLPTQEGL